MVSLFGKIFLPHFESLYPECEVDGIVSEYKSVIVLAEFAQFVAVNINEAASFNPGI